MKTKLIYNALAFMKDGGARKFKIKGVNLMNTRELYLRNSFVSLISAKSHSDDETDIALVINAPLESRWENMFLKNGIKVFVCPFDKFRLKGYAWELAFYKLCAMEYVTNMLQYDHLLQVDSDTIFIRDVTPLFEESKIGSVLLYEILYGLNAPMRKLINDDYRRYTGKINIISQ